MSQMQNKTRSSDEAGPDGPASKKLKTSYGYHEVHIKLEDNAAEADEPKIGSNTLPQPPPSDRPHFAETVSRIWTKKRGIEDTGRDEPSRKKRKPSELQLAVIAPSRKAKRLSVKHPQQCVGTTIARVPRSSRNITRSAMRPGGSTSHLPHPPQPEHTYQSSSIATFNYISCSTHHHFYGPTIHQYHGSSNSNPYGPRGANHNGDSVHFHGPSMHVYHVPPAVVNYGPSAHFHGPSMHIYRAPSALDHQGSGSSTRYVHSASNHRDWQRSHDLDEDFLIQYTPCGSSVLGPRGRVTEVSPVDDNLDDDTRSSRTIIAPSVAPLAESLTSSPHKPHPDTESEPTQPEIKSTRNTPPPTKAAPRRTSDRLKRKTPSSKESTTKMPNDPPPVRLSKQKKRKLADSS